MRENMNGSDFYDLNLKNDPYGRVKTLTNDTLFLNQRHVVNHLLKKLMCLMRLGDTSNPRMDQVLYYVYKTDKRMG